MKKWLAALLFVPAVVFGLPKPTGYVSDFSNVLKDKANIERRIGEYRKATTNEVAVVTVDTLGGEPIEDYANRLFKEWGIGVKGKNNGVLILVAVKDRKTRIEVGYGLESVLTDATCGRIIQEQMIPEFRRGSWDGGINNALTIIFDKAR